MNAKGEVKGIVRGQNRMILTRWTLNGMPNPAGEQLAQRPVQKHVKSHVTAV